MTLRFRLCPSCLEQYQALRFDETCDYRLNILPLCSLNWRDEHPENWEVECCDACAASIVRLAGARTYLWRHGVIPPDRETLWADAQRLIPDWPGFRRLTIDEHQRQSLDDCAAELEDLMGAIAKDFPNVGVSHKDGGLTEFTAARDNAKAEAKRWWRFWK
jgi:hypothetical protein